MKSTTRLFSHACAKFVSSPSNQPVSSSGWALLALVRFLLATVVLLAHAERLAFSTPLTSFAASLGGYPAVIGFFLISGFSIAASVEREPSHFHVRRFHRIAWLYAAALILSVVPALISPEIHLTHGITISRPSLAVILGNAMLLQTFICPVILTNQPLWSLATECFYYAWAPRIRHLREMALVACIGLSVIGFVAVKYLAGHVEPPALSYGIPAATLLWAWLLGFGAYMFRNNALIMGMLVAVPAIVVDWRFGGIMPLTVLIPSAVIALAPRIRRMPETFQKILTWLGDISFPLYLIHFPIIIAMVGIGRFTDTNSILVVCLASSAALYYLIDLPTRAIARRLIEDRSALFAKNLKATSAQSA